MRLNIAYVRLCFSIYTIEFLSPCDSDDIDLTKLLVLPSVLDDVPMPDVVPNMKV